MRVLSAVVLSAALFVFSSIPAAAEQQCGLKLYGAFDLNVEQGITIPATVNGASTRFLIEPTSAYTGISEQLADELKVLRTSSDMTGLAMGGVDVRHVAEIALVIGGLRANSFPVFVIPHEVGQRDRNIVGSDVLRQVDLELDLAHAKVKLFSQDHCRGQVVYWAHAKAVVPIKREGIGVYSFAMQLDGHEVSAWIAPENDRTIMPLSLARSTLGLDSDSPGMTPIEKRLDDDFQWYRYPFKTLSSASLAIGNPAIYIYDDQKVRCHRYPVTEYWEAGCHTTNLSFIELGRNVLKFLRIYVAFGEMTAYITAANAE